MVEVHGIGGHLPHVPDDLTLAQFILDYHYPNRPIRPEGIPWLIEDATGRGVGYQEVQARTLGLANCLSFKYNIQENDVVCIFSPNHIDYPIAIWATHRLGAIVSGANPLYTADELAYQLRTIKAALIIVHPDSLPAAITAATAANIPADRIVLFDATSVSDFGSSHPTLQSLITYGLDRAPNFVERQLNPGEGKTKLAFLNFSSGTTGRPKAVAVPHYAPIVNCIQMAVHQKVSKESSTRFRPGETVLLVLPVYHSYGLVFNLLFMLLCGLSVVVVPRFHFENMLTSIVKYRVAHLSLVPPQIILLCKHPAVKKYDLSHVRSCVAGAAPVPAELTAQLLKVLPNSDIGQGFGMTETCTMIAMYIVGQKIGTFGSAGQIIPGITARVIKEDGSLAKLGELGELWVKSPANCLRYTNDAEATKETFVNGWVRTGDEVRINENAELFVVDRLKEIMKVRGFQVAPAELEGHLLDHPDVVDVCVVGIPDSFSGEVPLAFVVLHVNAIERTKDDPEESQKVKASIMKHVADHKVSYKHLVGGVEFVDVIPKTPSGKLLRRVLRGEAKKLNTRPWTKARL